MNAFSVTPLALTFIAFIEFAGPAALLLLATALVLVTGSRLLKRPNS